MNVFEAVKQSVTTRQAASFYGIRVGRNGMVCCPFHNDRTPSMKVDSRFYCFGCGASGDVIDFAANFFDLPLYEAAQRLAADFGVDANQPPTKEVLEKRRQKAEAPDERFEEACHKLDEAEYYLDILAFGDSYERAEVVNYLLVDGRLDKLKEKINGRDAA